MSGFFLSCHHIGRRSWAMVELRLLHLLSNDTCVTANKKHSLFSTFSSTPLFANLIPLCLRRPLLCLGLRSEGEKCALG